MPIAENLMSNIPHIDDLEIFVGMSYGDAKAKIEGMGHTIKLSASKNKPHWRYQRDYDPLNITLYVENNIVKLAWKG
jgi:hypothetical protein